MQQVCWAFFHMMLTHRTVHSGASPSATFYGILARHLVVPMNTKVLHQPWPGLCQPHRNYSGQTLSGHSWLPTGTKLGGCAGEMWLRNEQLRNPGIMDVLSVRYLTLCCHFQRDQTKS